MTRTATRATRRPTSGRGWAYGGAGLGGAVSIAANIAHSFVPPAARPGPGGGLDWSPPVGAVLGATFWPIALFVAVEIMARTPWRPGARWIALRWVGLLPVAFVAAFVSYRHLCGLLAFYGEDTLTATFGPLAVDGLMVMATGALLATAPTVHAARDGRDEETPDTTGSPDAAPLTAPVTAPAPTTVTASPTPRATRSTTTRPVTRGAGKATAKSNRRTPSGSTRERIARARAAHPEWTAPQLAEHVEVTERTVWRHLRDLDTEARVAPDTATPPVTDTTPTGTDTHPDERHDTDAPARHDTTSPGRHDISASPRHDDSTSPRPDTPMATRHDTDMPPRHDTETHKAPVERAA